MKYVVDTCGWIEWLTEGVLCSAYEPYLKKPENVIVPTVVQYELYKWISRTRSESEAYEVIAVTQQGTLDVLDTSLALIAADASLEHSLAMADALVYASALKHKVLLITSDQHFEGLPQVEYIRKLASSTLAT